MSVFEGFMTDQTVKKDREIQELKSQLAQLTRERDQAFAALKPFADYGADFLKEAHIPDNESLPWLVGRTAKITYRQLRAAALAMGKEK